MSLTRVASVEGFERNTIDSNVSSTRRLSFNPMPDLAQLPPSDAKAAVVQELQFQEVSKPRRILQVGIAILYCLFAAGVVFGYAAMYVPV